MKKKEKNWFLFHNGKLYCGLPTHHVAVPRPFYISVTGTSDNEMDKETKLKELLMSFEDPFGYYFYLRQRPRKEGQVFNIYTEHWTDNYV